MVLWSCTTGIRTWIYNIDRAAAYSYDICGCCSRTSGCEPFFVSQGLMNAMQYIYCIYVLSTGFFYSKYSYSKYQIRLVMALFWVLVLKFWKKLFILSRSPWLYIYIYTLCIYIYIYTVYICCVYIYMLCIYKYKLCKYFYIYTVYIYIYTLCIYICIYIYICCVYININYKLCKYIYILCIYIYIYICCVYIYIRIPNWLLNMVVQKAIATWIKMSLPLPISKSGLGG